MLELPLDEFNWRNKDKGTRQTYCKPCQSDYTKQHYKSNKQPYLDRARKRNKDTVDKNFPLLLDYLHKHPCVDCGEADPIVLDFDHRESSEKLMNVSNMLRRNTSWDTILTEIEKCDVRCANCHRRRTALQFGWRKARLLP